MYFLLLNLLKSWTAWKNRRTNCKDLLCNATVSGPSFLSQASASETSGRLTLARVKDGKGPRISSTLWKKARRPAVSVSKHLDGLRGLDDLAHLLHPQHLKLHLFYRIKSKNKVGVQQTLFRHPLNKLRQHTGRLELLRLKQAKDYSKLRLFS